jgi:hypothetical protein
MSTRALLTNKVPYSERLQSVGSEMKPEFKDKGCSNVPPDQVCRIFQEAMVNEYEILLRMIIVAKLFQ